VSAQQRATPSRGYQSAMQLLQQHCAGRRPCPQGNQAPDRVGMRKAEASQIKIMI